MKIRKRGINLTEIVPGLVRLSRVAARKLAADLAVRLSADTKSAYVSGRTVMGTSRPLGKRGRVLDLVETTATRDTLSVAVYRQESIRAMLTTRWAKYLVGKYRVLPIARSRIPEPWQRLIAERAKLYLDRETS